MDWEFDWPSEIEHPAEFEKAFGMKDFIADGEAHGGHHILQAKYTKDIWDLEKEDVLTFTFAGRKWMFFRKEEAAKVFALFYAAGVIDLSEFEFAYRDYMTRYKALEGNAKYEEKYLQWLAENGLVAKPELDSYKGRAAIDKKTLEIKYLTRKQALSST